MPSLSFSANVVWYPFGKSERIGVLILVFGYLMYNALVVESGCEGPFHSTECFLSVIYFSINHFSLSHSIFLSLSICISSSVAHFSLWEIRGWLNWYKWGCLLEAAVASLLHLAVKEEKSSFHSPRAMRQDFKHESVHVCIYSVYMHVYTHMYTCSFPCVLHLTESFQPKLEIQIYDHVLHQVLFFSSSFKSVL